MSYDALIMLGLFVLFAASFGSVGVVVAAWAGLSRWRSAYVEEQELLRHAPGWSEAAERLGFQRVSLDEMAGTFRGRPARVKWRDGAYFLEVVVSEPVLVAGPPGYGGERGFETGDEAFDSRFDVQNPGENLSVLRRAVRDAMVELSALGPVRVNEGHLRVAIDDGDDPEALIRGALEALSGFADVVLDNEAGNLGVVIDALEPTALRLAALRTLGDLSASQVAALQPALDDASELLRWSVALVLGDEERLFRMLRDASAPVRAVDPVGGVTALSASDERLLWQDLAERVARHSTPGLSMAVVRFFEAHDYDVPFLRSEDAGHIALNRLALGLENAPVEGMEHVAAALLLYPIELERRRFVLNYLAAHGTVDVVRRLRATQPQVGPRQAEVIEAAIMEIQGNSGGSVGAVSVVEVGSLRGAVSLVNKEGA